MIAADQDHFTALMAAFQSGKPPDEDNSQGHALSSDPAMRAAEQKAIQFAASNLDTVRNVLKNSSDGGQRATAAWIIGYAPDKRLILDDLIDAARDPDETVRNNSTRALGVIAEFASEKPELGIHIDPTRFVDMLNSLTWTDRNKASMVLNGLGRSPDAVSQMRQRALSSIVEMARWKDSHSLDALFLLGHIAGLDDDEVQKAWDKGERERIIALATAPVH
jgi:HEAT repeat protein